MLLGFFWKNVRMRIRVRAQKLVYVCVRRTLSKYVRAAAAENPRTLAVWIIIYITHVYLFKYLYSNNLHKSHN